MQAMLDLIEVGKQAFANKDFDQAQECLETVLQEGRPYADLLNMMGVIYHHRGEFNDSIKAFEKALKINPDYMEPRLNLTVLLNDLGHYAAARKLYTKLGKKPSAQRHLDPIINGKMANQHAMMGDAYRRLGKFAEAADEYRQALKLGPSYADIRTCLGTALRESGDISSALRELRRACKDKPHFLEARVQLGLTLFNKGQKKEAQKEWKAVLKKDPQNPKAQIFLSLGKVGQNGTKPKTAKKSR